MKAVLPPPLLTYTPEQFCGPRVFRIFLAPQYSVNLNLFMSQNMFGYIWEYVYTSFLRYWLKWLIRQVTGTCELQRICSGHKPGAARTTKAGALNHPKSALRLHPSTHFLCSVNVLLVSSCRVLSSVIKEQGKDLLPLLAFLSGLPSVVLS